MSERVEVHTRHEETKRVFTLRAMPVGVLDDGAAAVTITVAVTVPEAVEENGEIMRRFVAGLQADVKRAAELLALELYEAWERGR